MLLHHDGHFSHCTLEVLECFKLFNWLTFLDGVGFVLVGLSYHSHHNFDVHIDGVDDIVVFQLQGHAALLQGRNLT